MYTFDWNKGKKWWLLLGQKIQSVALLLRLCRLQTFFSKFDPPLATSNVCSCQSMNRRTLTTKQFIDGAWATFKVTSYGTLDFQGEYRHTQKLGSDWDC